MVLGLEENFIDKKAAQALYYGLKSNTNLMVFHLSGNALDPKYEEAIENLLSRNKINIKACVKLLLDIYFKCQHKFNTKKNIHYSKYTYNLTLSNYQKTNKKILKVLFYEDICVLSFDLILKNIKKMVKESGIKKSDFENFLRKIDDYILDPDNFFEINGITKNWIKNINLSKIPLEIWMH